MLIGPDEQVSAIVDWANAAAGNPDLDRARTLTILTLDPAAIARRTDPRWSALSRGWIESGALSGVPAAARGWACRFMLADLGARYAPAQLDHVRAGLDLGL